MSTELPSLDSQGLRVVFARDYLTVVRDCVVGRWTGGGAGAVSIEMLSALDKFGDASAAHELALVRVIDGAEVASFRCDRVCRACIALGDDRLLLVEGGDLVSRRNDGSDRVVVYAGIMGDEEALTSSLVTDGTIAALVVSDENERSTCRVVDIARRALRWERTIGAEGAYVEIHGTVVLVLAWFSDDDASYFAFDAETGAERWSREVEAHGYDSSVFSASAVWGRDGALLVGEFGPDGGIAPLVIDIESGVVRATGNEAVAWRTRARGRTLVRCSDDTIELREGDVTRARFAVADSVASAFSLGDRRWCVVGRRSVAVVAGEPAEVLAGAWVRPAQWTTTRLHARGDGWVMLIHQSEDGGRSLEPLGAQNAPRVLSIARALPARVASIETATIVESLERNALHADAVDRERFSSILAVAREEQWNDAAAWERLVARGLVCPSPSRHELALSMDGRLYGTATDRTLSAEAQRAEWLAVAHDFDRMRTAEAVAKELLARLRPWMLAAPTSVRWCFAGSELDLSLAPFERARACLSAVVTCGDLPSLPSSRALIAALDALWSIANEAGDVLPDFAPVSLASEPFSSVPSPFAPCVALLEMGIIVSSVRNGALVLGIAGINERGERERPIDDIPF